MPQLFLPLIFGLCALAFVAGNAKRLKVSSFGFSASDDRDDVVDGWLVHLLTTASAKAVLVGDDLWKKGLGGLGVLSAPRCAITGNLQPKLAVLRNPLSMSAPPFFGVCSVAGLTGQALAFRAVVTTGQSGGHVAVLARLAAHISRLVSGDGGCTVRISDSSHPAI